MNTTIAQRRFVRAAVGAHASCPVVVVAGDRAPRLRGRSYYWTCSPSPDSTECRHPSAFARRGWRAYYQASSLRVEVGATWLAHAGDVPASRSAAYDIHEAA